MPTGDDISRRGKKNAMMRTATLEQLPYASTNWIRFEGSPCRACADGLSVPCRDSPSQRAS
jgi:hypothetical protein